jgi:hypothetical protein
MWALFSLIAVNFIFLFISFLSRKKTFYSNLIENKSLWFKNVMDIILNRFISFKGENISF